MINSKTIIIKRNNKDIFFKYLNNKNVYRYYKSLKENYLFRLFRKLESPLLCLYYGEWKKIIKDVDRVIMFDTGYNNYTPRYIKKKNANCKIILWFWNPVNSFTERFLNNEYVDEVWTYSKLDAAKYNLKYNTQFYSKSVVLSKQKTIDDVLFLGVAKERENDIKQIEGKLNNKGVSTNFKIINNQKDYLSYEEYLRMIERSKCILDYNKNNNISLRPLEALFFEKKLITDNSDIINYDFYNPNNIFILGKDNLEDIKKFIELPYEKIDSKIIEEYDFESWMKRFEVKNYEF